MAKSKAFDAKNFLQWLEGPGGSAATFGFKGHYNKFTFNYNSGDEANSYTVTSKFFSNGDVSVEQYLSHIKGMLAYLNYNFETVGELIDRKNNCYELKFKKKSTVVVRFKFVAKIITTDKEDDENLNRGQKYERDMINKMNALGYTTQTKPEESESNADIVLTINGITARIELKTRGAEYGSGTLEWIGNTWRLKDTRKTNKALKGILKYGNIMGKLSNDWVSYGFTPPPRATKEAQTELGEKSYPIISDLIRKYYSTKCDYLNFEGNGLFRVSERDPFNLKVPLFNPTTCTARARVQSKKDEEGPFAYRISLTASNLNRSPKSLDGDLKFLEEINNNKPQV